MAAKRFKKGVSGNPKGRPPGRPDARRALRDSLAGELPAIVKKLVAAAKGGCVQSATLLLSRCLPPLRSTSDPVEVAGLGSAQSLSARVRAVLAAIGAGELSAADAAALVAVLAQAADIERDARDDEDETTPEPVKITRRVVDASIPE